MVAVISRSGSGMKIDLGERQVSLVRTELVGHVRR